MKATKILMEEHRLIERMLAVLHTATDHLSQGGKVSPTFFTNASIFIKNFADGCHHHKEEDILFIAMSESGVPVQGGPIGVMLIEHEQGREFNHRMVEAIQKWEAGDFSARATVIQNARGYVALLRQHIYKEDNILFPMAERFIPPEQQEKVEVDFDRTVQEETVAGVREKYSALVESLETELQRNT